MRWRSVGTWLIWATAICLLVSGASAKPNDEFEQQITRELSAIDASLVDAFARANAARAKDDHALAERLYAEVFEKAPSFYHAERRRCGELLHLDRREEALLLCRHAVEKDPSAANLGGLASAILYTQHGKSLSTSESDEAVELLRRAEALDPNDSHIAMEQCQLAIERKDLPGLRDCNSRLERLAPSEPFTAWSAWLVAMSEGHFSQAQAAVERARKLGAPPKMLANMTEATASARPWTDIVLYWGVRVVGAWLALAFLLVVIGSALSRATLSTAENWSAESAKRGAALRSVYRGVLVVCSLLYYVSLPLVLLAVVALAGGLVYGMFAIGYIPIKLGLIAALMVFATGGALIKSLLFRPSDEAPGAQVDLAKEPGLRAALDEVAAQIGTRPVDVVYMTADTNLAVFERKKQRCLVLGAGVLDGMPLDSFKAILAHEYGHFSHRDTAGGGFALSVRRSLITFIIGLAQSGHASPWNPAWWFARGFYNVFLRISQGASRLQEVLADRRAAEAYGGLAFANGLKHVVACDLRFETHVNNEIERALKEKEPLKGLWSPLAGGHGDAQELEEALNREPSPYDSHPSPSDRIRWVKDLAGCAAASSNPDAKAWDLFQNRAYREREATLYVYQRLAENGVRLAALPAGQDSAANPPT